LKPPFGYAAVAEKIIFNVLKVSVNSKRYKTSYSCKNDKALNYVTVCKQEEKEAESQVVPDRVGIVFKKQCRQ